MSVFSTTLSRHAAILGHLGTRAPLFLPTVTRRISSAGCSEALRGREFLEWIPRATATHSATSPTSLSFKHLQTTEEGCSYSNENSEGWLVTFKTVDAGIGLKSIWVQLFEFTHVRNPSKVAFKDLCGRTTPFWYCESRTGGSFWAKKKVRDPSGTY